MTPDEKEKNRLCRVVASLIALSTSGNAGEAANAADKARALIAEHGLLLHDVLPHCNAVAVTVRLRFWPEAPPKAGPDETRTRAGFTPPWGHTEPKSTMWNEAPFGGYASYRPHFYSSPFGLYSENELVIKSLAYDHWKRMQKHRTDKIHDTIEQGHFNEAIYLLRKEEQLYPPPHTAAEQEQILRELRERRR